MKPNASNLQLKHVDFQQRQQEFLEKQHARKQELRRQEDMKFTHTPEINERSKQMIVSPSRDYDFLKQ